MALDDYLEAEVGIAVAATAALLSPRVRKFLRRGAVIGVAGALMAGDALVSFAKGVGHGAQQAAASATQKAQAAAAATNQTAKTAAPGREAHAATHSNKAGAKVGGAAQ